MPSMSTNVPLQTVNVVHSVISQSACIPSLWQSGAPLPQATDLPTVWGRRAEAKKGVGMPGTPGGAKLDHLEIRPTGQQVG